MDRIKLHISTTEEVIRDITCMDRIKLHISTTEEVIRDITCMDRIKLNKNITCIYLPLRKSYEI